MIARNNVLVRVVEDDPQYPADVLTSEEVAIIQARTALKIYEPLCSGGEILFTVDGDCYIQFGGLYAT